MPAWAVPDFVALHAAAQPARRACVDLETGRSWTYSELQHSIGCCVSVLSARGIRPGDRIAVLARNSVWQLILQQASTRLGATFTPLNWRLAAPEISGLLADCEPALLVADPAGQALIAGLPVPSLAMEELAAISDAATPSPLAGADADAASMLLYTSGTSGRSKGVIVTERNAFFTASNFSVLGQVDRTSVFLVDSPMFHVIGLLTSLRPALMQGGTILMSNGFDAARSFSRLADPSLGITHYFCVPQMAQMLRGAPGFEGGRLRHLKALFTGGAPNPATNILGWLKDGVRMVDGYGMTEAGTVLGMPLDERLLKEKAGAVGLPAPTLSLRLADDDGAEVPAGEVGELQLRGPNVTPGYWRQPEETAAAFTADGWFRTGDFARRDLDGFVTLVGRRKDMFISGGENVYPAEIERVLADHPGVSEAAVIGVPDAIWGEVGRAFVVARSPEAGLAAALELHCGARLARFKVPKSFVLLDRLPRTGSGKVMKQALRDAMEAA